MRCGPSPQATEAARVLVAGSLKGDADSIAAALSLPREAWIADTHREIMRALRVLSDRGMAKPETTDYLGVIDHTICGPFELSVLAEPTPSTNPTARAETLRTDLAHIQWERKAVSFAHRLPALTPDAARVEFSALIESVHTPADGWPVPEALPDTVCSVEPFRPELMPDSLRAFVTDAAERLQCPADFPAVAVMVALGSLVGRQCGMRPKRQDDWTVIANLWGGIVGAPSVKKTPAMQPAIDLLSRLEAKSRKAFDTALADFNRKIDVQALRVKAAKKTAMKVAEDGGDEDAIRTALDAAKNGCISPTRRRYLTNDPTVEKLGELLRESPNGLLVFRDELTGWLRALDRDGHESDRPFYLEAWNGTGRFTCDRIGRGTIEIDAACVSILGGIQPGPLTEYFRSAMHNGAGADGLVQRFQLLVWPEVSREWRNVDRWPDTSARDTALAVCERLSSLDAFAIGAESDPWGGIPFLRFELDAQDEFYRWQGEFNRRLRSGNDTDPVNAHLAKYESMVASLALLLHLTDSPAGGPVSRLALERALGWAEYLESHARRVYGSCVRGDLDAARALLRHVENGDLPSPFTAKNVYRNHWAGLSRHEIVEAALGMLEDFGWVRAHKVDTGGRPTIHYTAHPSLRKVG